MVDHLHEKIEFRETVERIWAKHSEEIYSLCVQKCANVEEARDLYQTIALKVCENLQNLVTRPDVMPWVIAVIRNTYLDIAIERDRMRTISSVLEGSPDYMPFSVEDAMFYSHPVTVEQRVFLSKILGLLNPLERMLLEMRYLGGFSIRELSAVLGMSENAVRKRRLYAFKKIRRFYKENDIMTKNAD